MPLYIAKDGVYIAVDEVDIAVDTPEGLETIVITRERALSMISPKVGEAYSMDGSGDPQAPIEPGISRST